MSDAGAIRTISATGMDPRSTSVAQGGAADDASVCSGASKYCRQSPDSSNANHRRRQEVRNPPFLVSQPDGLADGGGAVRIAARSVWRLDSAQTSSRTAQHRELSQCCSRLARRQAASNCRRHDRFGARLPCTATSTGPRTWRLHVSRTCLVRSAVLDVLCTRRVRTIRPDPPAGRHRQVKQPHANLCSPQLPQLRSISTIREARVYRVHSTIE